MAIIIGGITWHSIEETTPPQRTLLMVTGPSGMIPGEMKRHSYLALAYLNEEYRPSLDGRPRWINIHDDALTDGNERPTHWAYRIQLPGDLR